jgi:hypothetical protein
MPAYSSFWRTLNDCQSVVHGSVALAAVLAATECLQWHPRNLNIAMPRCGIEKLYHFLSSAGYTRQAQNVQEKWRQCVRQSDIWRNAEGKLEIWVTRSVDSSVLPVVFGSTTTATMSLITNHRIFCFYPCLAAAKRAVYGSYAPGSVDREKHRKWGVALGETAGKWGVPCGEACGRIRRRVKGGRGTLTVMWDSTTTEIQPLDHMSYIWWLGSRCGNEDCPG